MTKLLFLVPTVAAFLSLSSCEKEEAKDQLYIAAENDIKLYLQNNNYKDITISAESKQDVYLSDIYSKISKDAPQEFKQQFLDSAKKYINNPNNNLGVAVKCLTKYYKNTLRDVTFYYAFYYNNNQHFVYQFDCDLDNFVKENYIFNKK